MPLDLPTGAEGTHGNVLTKINSNLTYLDGKAEPRTFRITSYGAVAYTTYSAAMAGTSSTVAIKNAIAACYAAGGGTVYFDPGFYRLSGPLTTGSGFNTLIPLPTHAAGKISINLHCHEPCAAMLWEYGPSNNGAILCPDSNSYAYDSTNYMPSVLGGKSFLYTAVPNVADFSNLYVSLHGIQLRMQRNPALTGFDMGLIAACDLKDFNIHTQTTGTLFDIDEPTNSWAWGVIMPRNNNNVLNKLGNFSIMGMHVGIGMGEHTTINGMGEIFMSRVGLASMRLINHPWGVTGRVTLDHCNYCIASCNPDPATGATQVDGSALVNLQFVAIEDGETTDNTGTTQPWYRIRLHVWDDQNYLKGRFRFARIPPGVGNIEGPLVMNGGDKLVCENLAEAYRLPLTALRPSGATSVLKHTFPGTSTTAAGSADTGQAVSNVTGTWGRNAHAAYLATQIAGLNIIMWDAAAANGQFGVDVDVPPNAYDFGFIFRGTDLNNFLVFEFNRTAGGGNFANLSKRVSGTLTSLWDFTSTVTDDLAGGTKSIRVVANGVNIDLYFNGRLVFSWTTTTGLDTGTKIGFWAFNATGYEKSKFCRFLNLRATSLT